MAANNNSTTVTYTFSSAIKASEVGLLLEDIYTASSTGSISVAGGTATTSDFNLGTVSNTNAYNTVSFSNPFNYDGSTGNFSFPNVRSASALIGNSDKTLTSITLTIDNLGSGDVVALSLLPMVGCDNDFDNDTIPNHLDLDSDGDGCPDALEGNAGLNYPILDSEGKIDTTVNNNGIPITLGVGTSGNGTTGQTKGTSQNDAVQADECDPCNSTSTLFKDSDNDTIGDDCDLDDDNDGILDSDESCTSTAIAHNGSNWLAPDGVGTGITVSNSSTTTSSTVSERTRSSASEITVNTSLNFSVLKDLLINPMAANNNSTTVTFTFSSAIKASEVGLLLEDIYTASSTGSISVAGGTATTSDFNLGTVSNTNAYNTVSFSNPFNYDGSTGNFSFPNVRSASALIGNSDKTLTSITLTIDNLT